MSNNQLSSVPFGKLNCRLVIERALNQTDEAGGMLAEWQPWKTIWANIEPIANTEHNFLSNVKGNLVSHVITIRYLAELQLSDRFCWHTRIFYPYSIINEHEAGRFQLILTKELINETPLLTDAEVPPVEV